MTILVHGFSRVVLATLALASKTKHFNVIALEGRSSTPGEIADGIRIVKHLTPYGIPVKIVLDSAIGYVMSSVDLVLVGAEAVVESGGIINKIGTNSLSIVAKAYKKPLYVACESYKFARIFPVTQNDIPTLPSAKENREKALAKMLNLPDGASVENPNVDYTPPEYVTYLVTDLGVFTPSAVSDELIRLHQ